MARTFNRRRAIAIFAAAAGLPLLPAARADLRPVTWSGHALGAPSTLVLNHPDGAQARRLIGRVVAEVARLESVFSLYRDDSALVELNRVRALAAPPSDLVSVLEACRRHWESSGGAFDPTVQPLWALYRDHFAQPGADPAGPTPDRVAHALDRVGFDAVSFNRDRVVLSRPGMALTLNGIAQGYITDRVVEMLRDAGVTSSLVDMGEDRAIGSKPDGTPWRIGLADRQDADRPDTVLDVVDRAVATSSPVGFMFDEAGRFGHIVDPGTGRTPASFRRLTVVAGDATTADALSTAFSLMDGDRIRSTAASYRGVTVDFVSSDGDHVRVASPV